MIPEIKELFQKIEDELHDILFVMDSQNEEYLIKKPNANSWSAAQALYHLYISEYMGLEYVEKKLSNPELAKTFKITDENHEQRLSKLISALNSETKIKAPDFLNTIPEDINYSELKDKFLTLRKKWQDTLEKFDLDLAKRETFRHPYAEKFNILQMLQFTQIHLQRHKQQIKLALEQVS